MHKKISGLLLLFFTALIVHAQELPLRKGMLIKKSVKIKKDIYAIGADDSLNNAVIIIEGNNIVVDFKNAMLDGNTKQVMPDKFSGVAVIVRNGKNITIKNLTAKGFRIALLARNVQGLKIDNCDFSYNYRQHLNSTQEKEDISDWMSYHHNEKDEWLRYGAAMYLRGCNDAVISNSKVTGGQNALMLMECNRASIYNNDFSFNSGIGIGMYRSSDNQIMYNRLNFNVRGYSDGVYSRGQDSAGILVYEQSNRNLFYKNSATHGGDGFFLWAGQTTMDTGQGGCNDNKLIENDFSYAPANGIEVTFSRNFISRNRMFECDYGVWGGYSYNSTIAGNQFRNNRIAIAIEHGQFNNISDNIFFRDGEAIRLWSGNVAPDWGYAKYHDTRSVGFSIYLNSFNNLKLALNIAGTDSLNIFNNRFSNVDEEARIDSNAVIDSTAKDIDEDAPVRTMLLPKANDPFKGNGKLVGRKNIMITEWGPYDFRYPLIWNTNPTDTSDIMKFDVLGPKGRWKIISVKGLEMPEMIADSFPIKFSSRRLPSERTDIEIIAEYMGPAFVDQFGNKIAENKPYRFSYRKFFQPIDFEVSFYDYDSSNYRVVPEFLHWIKDPRPFRVESVRKLDYAWWGGIKLPGSEQVHPRFVTIATGQADLLAGTYELGITWDDGVRVYLDGAMLIDEWDPSKYSFDESPNKKLIIQVGSGTHTFRVEHFEKGGFATLSLKLNKVN
jgi:parallel beta-helix repeat protein